MFSQKTRVIIASILLIAALALALRGRIIWDEITQWITVHSLPLIIAPSAPLEKKDTLSEQPSPAHIAPQVSTDSQAPATAITSDEPQIIPTPETIEAVLQQIRADAVPKKSRVARRRRKKETEPVFAAPPISTSMETLQTSQLLQASPVSDHKEPQPAPPLSPISVSPQQTSDSPIVVELVSTKAENIAVESRVAPKKTIRICNKIDAHKLGVKHWTGTYTPTKLEITLNNIPFTIIGTNPIACEALHEIPCADNRITVCYHYEFLNGMRKGSDTVIYTITDKPAQLEMHFSWDTPWHVELHGAQRVDS